MINENSDRNLKIGELPDLRIVAIDSLLFHEEPDRERLQKLIKRLDAETILKNPPIAARMNGNPRTVILDGANRTTAMKMLGFKHIAVQIVDFEDELLSLHCWHHAVDKLDRRFFMIKLSQLDGIKAIEREPFFTNGDMRQLPADEDDYLCRIIFRDNSVLAVKGSTDNLEQIRQLKEITSLYLNMTGIDRVSYINLENLISHYPEFECLVSFRHIDKQDFREMIDSGMKLPAGITRVFMPKRALGLNIQLELLKSDLTIEEKNRRLDKIILKKVREKSIRFYREPSFRFDE